MENKAEKLLWLIGEEIVMAYRYQGGLSEPGRENLLFFLQKVAALGNINPELEIYMDNLRTFLQKDGVPKEPDLTWIKKFDNLKTF